MHRVECEAIVKHLRYYYWCVYEMWYDFWYPKCKECGIRKSQ